MEYCVKKSDVMSAYEEQLKKYEKLSFSDAQEKIKNYDGCDDSINKPEINDANVYAGQFKSSTFPQLSPYTRQIYNELKLAIEQKKQGGTH